jgi:ribosomal protein L37AE/L43A
MKEVSWEIPIEKAEFIFKREFMLMEHNYLCAVCKELSAVQNTSTGILEPCWECQKRGYALIKKTWIDKLLSR